MPELLASVPERVLAVYAHPDDPDIGAGGTLAAWAAAGASVYVCICADGDKGSVDPAMKPSRLVARRRQEVAAAGAALGVVGHHWLGYRDGEVEDTAELRGRLVELIRSIQPDAVVGPDPTAVFFGQHYANHRDHRSVGWATLDAVSPAASNPHYFPAAGSAHRVRVMYLSGTMQPDVWVDVTGSIERKAAAIACHGSQVGEPGEWLRQAVLDRAEQAGRDAGVRYAESFRRLILE